MTKNGPVVCNLNHIHWGIYFKIISLYISLQE